MTDAPPRKRQKKDTDPISAAIRNARRNWVAQIEAVEPTDEPKS